MKGGRLLGAEGIAADDLSRDRPTIVAHRDLRAHAPPAQAHAHPMAGLLRGVSQHVQGDACGQLLRHDEVEPSIAVHIHDNRAAAVEALAQSHQKTRLHKCAFAFVKKKCYVCLRNLKMNFNASLLVSTKRRDFPFIVLKSVCFLGEKLKLIV